MLLVSGSVWYLRPANFSAQNSLQSSALITHTHTHTGGVVVGVGVGELGPEVNIAQRRKKK